LGRSAKNRRLSEAVIDDALPARDGFQPVLHGERLRGAQRIKRRRGEFSLGGLEPVDGGDDRLRI
jgi:hypothetical protein